MKRSFILAVMALYTGATTTLARADDLTVQQVQGRQLFQQSCGVCHTKPTITSPLFGPVLSKTTFAMGDEQPRRQIADGSPNMPGFKYMFTPTQIDAIVAYLKTTTEEQHKPQNAR